MTSLTGRTKYQSECHCGAVHVDFSTDVPLEQKDLKVCKCTICTKNGYINVYPEEEYVTIQDAENLLRDYTFVPHNRKHKFCSRCGTSMLIIPNELVYYDAGKVGINIRSVKDIDIEKLKLTYVAGPAPPKAPE